MRIAEYKQTGTEQVEKERWVDTSTYDDDGNLIEESGHFETYIEEVPVMGLVYRDQTPEEQIEMQTMQLETLNRQEITVDDYLEVLKRQVEVTTPTRAVQKEGVIDLPFKAGYRWDKVISATGISFELVPDPNALGSADNPIVWHENVEMISGAYYLVEGVRHVNMDGELVEF